MNIISLTDVGLIRESNQDHFCVESLSDDIALAIVCDGMGGPSGGHVASKMAVDIIREYVFSNYKDGMESLDIKEMLVRASQNANGEIYKYAGSDEGLKGMGTTVVIAFIYYGTAYIVSAGDSRAYLITDSEATQITHDHSIVQDMVDRGEITEFEARSHPRKNIITRALGVDEFIDVDYFDITFDLGQMIFICTDGFSNYISKENLLVLAKNADFNTLAREAVSLAKGAGGNDNITVVVIKG